MGRAIVREPKVFLFDEPLSNLDAKLRVAMRLEIMKLHRRLGTTSLYVTHDQVEAMTLAHRMIVMYQGVLEQIGTPMEVFEKPASTFVAGFIGSPPMNLMEVNVAGDGTVQTADGQPLRSRRCKCRPRSAAQGHHGHASRAHAAEHARRALRESRWSKRWAPSNWSTAVGKTTLVVRCTTRQLSESPPRSATASTSARTAAIRCTGSRPTPAAASRVSDPALRRTGTGAACGARFRIRQADPPALFHQYVYVTIVPTEY